MAKKLIPLPSVSRVAPSSVAFIEVPIGVTYENINLVMTGTGLAATMVDNIKLIGNGQELMTFLNLQQLIDLNNFHGRATDTAADWCIHFKNDDYLQLDEKLMQGLGTLGLQTLVLEISLNATWPANGTIVAYANIDTKSEPLGAFNRIRQTVLNAPAAGEIEFDKLIRGGAIYNQIHFFKADITKVVLEADSVKVIDASKGVLERQQKNVRPTARVPQTAKATHLDFIQNGFYGDAFRTDGMNDLRVRLTVGSAGAINIVTEQLDVFRP